MRGQVRETGPASAGRPAGGVVRAYFGRSPAVRRVQTLIDRIKDADAPIFLSGESGTGKELVARTIHETGKRRHGPFVAVNCGAIPDHLLESELFGHARGSFTGAVRDKVGLIEEAHRGTFFMDEIGDLGSPLQAKLLRVLEERAIRRVGETRSRDVDARFISATNKNLDREVERGAFREDLYFRLKIIAIELPPLRDRREDILPLVEHFAAGYARAMGRSAPCFTPGALALFLAYPWPGNVRELQNEVQRSLILAGDGDVIDEADLSSRLNPRGSAGPAPALNFLAARAEFEKRFLREALFRCGHKRKQTAIEIGLTRQGLFKLMRKHGLCDER